MACWAARAANGNRPAQKGYGDWEQFLKGDEPLLIHGEVKVNARDEEHPRAELTAVEIEPLSRVRSQKTSEIALRIDAERLTEERVVALKALLGRHPGGCAVTVRAVIPGESETTISVPHKASPADDLLEAARRAGFEPELR